MINVQLIYKVIGSFGRWSGLHGLEEKYLLTFAVQMLFWKHTDSDKATGL